MKRDRVDINSLPPEIVAQIVQHVIDITTEEREAAARNPFGVNLEDMMEGGPQAFLQAMMGGFLGNGAAAAQAAAQAQAQETEDARTLAQDQAQQRARAATAGFDDMPTLEDISDNEARAVPRPPVAAVPVPRVGVTPERGGDEMPALEPISEDEAAPPPHRSATSSVPLPANTRGTNSINSATNGMPPLEPIPANQNTTRATPAAQTTTTTTTTTTARPAAPSHGVDSDDDLPALEEINPTVPAPAVTNKGSTASGKSPPVVDKKPNPLVDEGMPELEPIDDDGPPTPKASTQSQASSSKLASGSGFKFSFPKASAASSSKATPTPASKAKAAPAVSSTSSFSFSFPSPAASTTPGASTTQAAYADMPSLENISGDDDDPPEVVLPRNTAARPSENSDDELPPLEPIPSKQKQAAKPPPKPTPAQKAPAKKAPSAYDDMPVLEDISSADDGEGGAAAPTKKKAKKKKKKKPSAAAAAAAAVASAAALAKLTQEASDARPKTKLPGSYEDSDSDGPPPLEELNPKDKGKGKAVASKAEEATSSESESESEPEKDSESESESDSEIGSESGDDSDEDSDDDNSKGSGSHSGLREADDYEPSGSHGAQDGNGNSSDKKKDSSGSTSKGNKLEEVDSSDKVTSSSASGDLEEDNDYETYEEEDSEEEDEDENSYDDDDDEDEDEDGSDSDEDVTFKDGLPDEPLLPLAFSRPFLHAARQKLYRHIVLKSPYQASLLLRSISAAAHAARVSVEDLDETTSNSKNSLAHMTRSLVISPNPGEAGDISGGRGGASVYVEIITLCIFIETLTLMPTFLKSMTKPLLTALEGLERLKAIRVGSGIDPQKPLLFTTARIIRLMRKHWPELEELVVERIVSADEGPSSEEDEMWELSNDIKEIASGTGNPAAVKRKGLKILELIEPDTRGPELSIILADSGSSLLKLSIIRPSPTLDRYGLASLLLKFGVHLTELNLSVDSNWHPRTRPAVRVPTPIRPKGYIAGSPTTEILLALDNHVHFLDGVVSYLLNLKQLRFDGDLASTILFSRLPVSLSKIKWQRCPAIQPIPLSKLLLKPVTRVKVVTNLDGTTTNKSFRTTVARGLTCMTVELDDQNWSDAEWKALDHAAQERGACLHLSGHANEMFGGLPQGLAAAIGIPVF